MDTNERLADTAAKVLRGEVSPGVAASAARATFTLPADRRAQRAFFDAFATLRSKTQDAAALSSPACAQLMLRFLDSVAEHIPSQQQFDEAMQGTEQ